MKVEWVKQAYDYTLQDFSGGSSSDKVLQMCAIADAWDIKRDHILIVDDYRKVLDAAADAGFMTISPMQVVNFVDTSLEEERR